MLCNVELRLVPRLLPCALIIMLGELGITGSSAMDLTMPIDNIGTAICGNTTENNVGIISISEEESQPLRVRQSGNIVMPINAAAAAAGAMDGSGCATSMPIRARSVTWFLLTTSLTDATAQTRRSSSSKTAPRPTATRGRCEYLRPPQGRQTPPTSGRTPTTSP